MGEYRLPDFEIQFRAAEGIAFPSRVVYFNLEPNNPDAGWTVVFLHQFTHIMMERHDPVKLFLPYGPVEYLVFLPSLRKPSLADHADSRIGLGLCAQSLDRHVSVMDERPFLTFLSERLHLFL